MTFTKPSRRYQLELCQVRDAADDLLGFLAEQPNLLPIGFPSDAVITLCAALRLLPDGSVEGSVQVLEAGREQCPTIRRNYIPPEPDPDDPEFNPDAPPVFRGGELDDLINDLYVAIGTAIDAYKVEYSSTIMETIEIDPPVAAMPEFVLDAAVTNARRAENRIADFHKEYDSVLSKADELSRGLVDADSQLKVGRSTASMPEPKPNLLSRIGEKISRLPEALSIAGKAAQVVSDVSAPVVSAGTKIVLSSWQGILDAIAMAGEGIEESGRRLAAWRDRGWNRKVDKTNGSSSSSDGMEPFDEVVAGTLILAAEPLPKNWLPEIETLRLGGFSRERWTNINRSCRLIGQCKNLKYLDLSGSPVDNLSFLRGHSSLRELRLASSEVKSLSGIENLQSLRAIQLNGSSKLSDISPIASLKVLTSLHIKGTSVSTIEPLLSLDDIEILVVGENQINEYDLERLVNKFPDIRILQNSKRRRRRRRAKNSQLDG